MVSYDDTIQEESPLDFDDYVFDNSLDEYQTAPIGEHKETLVGSEMEVEISAVSGMELDADDQGVAPSQV
jgi:hypothetical protein